MTHQPWLEQVRRQLAAKHLPSVYVRRFMEELSDHFQDITEDTMSGETDLFSRLGEPARVAEAAVVSFRDRTFLGRHPVAALAFFGISPIVSLAAFFVLAFGCMYAFFLGCQQLGVNLNVKRFDPAASIVLPYVFSLLMVVVPAGLASLFYCRFIERLGIGRRWMILSSVILAAVAILPVWNITLSDQPGQSVLQCGVGNSLGLVDTLAWYFSSFRQWLQLLSPLVIGLWFLRRHTSDCVGESPLRLAA